MTKLYEKVAIVTGAGQGVGRGIALAMAKEGARIALAGRNPEKCSAVVAEIEAAGGTAIHLRCDVSLRDDVRRTVRESMDVFGAIDILVNNAHDTSATYAPFMDWTDDMLGDQMGTAYMATVWFMQECFPHMKQHGGRIINVGSGLAMQSKAGFLGYSACKAAQAAVTRVAAREWGQFGITANVLCPCADSPQMDIFMNDDASTAFVKQFFDAMAIPRVGRCEEDIGRAAVFLASEDASYITGYTLNVDGGLLIDGAR